MIIFFLKEDDLSSACGLIVSARRRRLEMSVDW